MGLVVRFQERKRLCRWARAASGPAPCGSWWSPGRAPHHPHRWNPPGNPLQAPCPVGGQRDGQLCRTRGKGEAALSVDQGRAAVPVGRGHKAQFHAFWSTRRGAVSPQVGSFRSPSLVKKCNTSEGSGECWVKKAHEVMEERGVGRGR